MNALHVTKSTSGIGTALAYRANTDNSSNMRAQHAVKSMLGEIQQIFEEAVSYEEEVQVCKKFAQLLNLVITNDVLTKRDRIPYSEALKPLMQIILSFLTGQTIDKHSLRPLLIEANHHLGLSINLS